MSTILGLTGSFGSGKSTVAGMFSELGVPVLDADQAARDVVAPGTAGLARIVEAFGECMLDREGSLDRKKLADHIFANEAARHRLNSIVHPLVGEKIAEFISANARSPVIVLEIPLLLEGGRKAPVNKVVVVTTDPEARLARLKASGFSEGEIEARLKAQMPQEEKIRLADHVIENDGDLQSTRNQVRELAEICGISLTGERERSGAGRPDG